VQYWGRCVDHMRLGPTGVAAGAGIVPDAPAEADRLAFRCDLAPGSDHSRSRTGFVFRGWRGARGCDRLDCCSGHHIRSSRISCVFAGLPFLLLTADYSGFSSDCSHTDSSVHPQFLAVDDWAWPTVAPPHQPMPAGPQRQPIPASLVLDAMAISVALADHLVEVAHSFPWRRLAASLGWVWISPEWVTQCR
jgi:hypothetical protein